MKTLELKAYEIFKNRFTEKEAEDLLNYFETKVNNVIEDKKEILATKEDITKVRVEIAENKSEMIKWMFIFWATQLAAMFAFLKYFIH
jgi:hypothetical protein